MEEKGIKVRKRRRTDYSWREKKKKKLFLSRKQLHVKGVLFIFSLGGRGCACILIFMERILPFWWGGKVKKKKKKRNFLVNFFFFRRLSSSYLIRNLPPQFVYQMNAVLNNKETKRLDLNYIFSLLASRIFPFFFFFNFQLFCETYEVKLFSSLDFFPFSKPDVSFYTLHFFFSL